MRQHAQVAQLSQCRDQGQARLLTPKPVLSSGPPPCSTGSQPWLGSGIPKKMWIQFVEIGTQVGLLLKALG